VRRDDDMLGRNLAAGRLDLARDAVGYLERAGVFEDQASTVRKLLRERDQVLERMEFRLIAEAHRAGDSNGSGTPSA